MESKDQKEVMGNVDHPAPNSEADDESAHDHTKVTPIFGSGRHLHGVEGEDEEGEKPAAQDKPEGIPPRNTHDDD